MKKYQKHNSAYYSGALVSILISTVFVVVLQFFKGGMLDHAIAGETHATLNYAVPLTTVLFEKTFTLYHLFRTGHYR